MKLYFTIFLLFLVIPNIICAQDYIYTNNKVILKGKIIGFEGEEIRFIEENTNNVVNKHIKDITIIINNKGHILLSEELLVKPEEREEAINDYFNGPQLSNKYDLLVYKQPFDIIRCNITYESNDIVNFKTIRTSEVRSENKKDLFLIIYVNGNHKFFYDPTLFSKELKSLKVKIKEKATPENKNITPPIVKNDYSDKPVLNNDEYRLYRKKAELKVDDFANFLSIISDKNTDSEEKDKAIEQTVKLFTPGATIEVSLKKPDGKTVIVTRKIEDYLKRLKLSPYSNVKIEWTNVQYISELKQEEDGNYYGIITGEQRFTGYGKNNNISYSDVVKKDVKVMVKSYGKIIDDTEKKQWEVFLGNIGIVEENK